MTAAADDRPSPSPGVDPGPRTALKWLVGALIVASLVCGSACTADSVNVGAANADASEAGATAQPGLVDTASSAVPEADEQAIRATIDEMNSAVGKGVAGQQETLAALVEPTLVKALDDCAPATTTLRFEPIYPGLRAAPGWTSKSGPLTGTVYALPTLIRIYTGDRITGTDLTTLHLGVQASEAFLTPLCVG